MLLIDSDFVLYKCCPNRVLSETERMYGVRAEKTLQETLDLVDWYLVEKIFKPTNADSYIGFLGGKGNFRYSIDSSYKLGRTTDRPPYFNEAKQHLVDKWGFVLVDDMESEDAVGICLTEYPEAIIVRVDHDLEQLPTVHFNPSKQEWITISNNEALYNFWKSLVTGCTSDKVKGIVNNRKNFVKKLIGDYDEIYMNTYEYTTHQRSFREVIHAAYIDLYGEYRGIEEFAKNYKLLKILREKEGFIIPEIRQVPTKPIVEVNDDLKF